MSSANSYPRCALDVHHSRTLFIFTLLIVVLAAVAPWLAALPWPLALLASVAVLFPARTAFGWARGEIRALVWQAEGRWQLVDAQGGEHDDARLESAYVTAHLLLLSWRCACCDRRFRAALLEDNCERDARRRLAVRLRVTPDAVLFAQESLPDQ